MKHRLSTAELGNGKEKQRKASAKRSLAQHGQSLVWRSMGFSLHRNV